MVVVYVRVQISTLWKKEVKFSDMVDCASSAWDIAGVDWADRWRMAAGVKLGIGEMEPV